MIKRMVLLLTALTLALTLSLGMLAVSPEGASAAPEEPGSSAPAAELCRQLREGGRLERAGLNVGECVNLFAGIDTGNSSRFIVGLCGSTVAQLQFANKGECINVLREFFSS